MTTAAQARAAIAAILASIPDENLPKPRIENNGERDVAWFDNRSIGFHLGSGIRNGEPHPTDHRNLGIEDMFTREAAHRLEKKLWESR